MLSRLDRRHFLAGASAATLAACASAKPAETASAEVAYPPLGRIIDLGGAKVHATDEGPRDAPPVILIHGASGNVRDWTFGITKTLSRRNRVIAMDRPGFGYSTRRADDDAWLPSAQAAQLRAATKAMGIERPVIVGHSWGAMVALAWAQDAPDEVRGVAAVSGVLMPWGRLSSALNALGLGDVIAGYYNRRITSRAEEGGIDDFIRRAFRPQSPPPGYIDYVGADLALRESTLAANRQDFANTPNAVESVAERYGEMTTPVEILHGDRDWLLGFDQHALGAAEKLPAANVTRLSGVGHMAHHARTDALAEAITRLA